MRGLEVDPPRDGQLFPRQLIDIVLAVAKVQ